MSHTMKKVIRSIGIVTGLAAAIWVMRDRLLPDPPPPTASPPRFRTGGTAEDDLTMIKGIGPAFAARLADAGITTFPKLAAGEAATIAEIANTTETTAQRWIDDAASHV